MRATANPKDRLTEIIEQIDARVISRIKAGSAWKEFQDLVNKGMPRDSLIGSLNVLSSLTSELLSYQTLTGFSSRSFKSIPASFRKAARLIRGLAAGRVDLLDLCFPPIEEEFTSLGALRAVAEFLEMSADRLEEEAPRLVGESECDGAIAQLVAEVTEKTGSPRDEQLSGLINAITGQIPTAEAMRMWRKRHAKLIQHMQRRFARGASYPHP